MLGIRISLEQGPAGSHCRVCLERSERMNERYSSSPSLYDSHSPSSGYGIPSGRRVLPRVVNVAAAAARNVSRLASSSSGSGRGSNGTRR